MNPTVLELFGRTRDTLGAFVRTEVVRERYRHMPADLLWRVVNLAKWLETFRPRVEV